MSRAALHDWNSRLEKSGLSITANHSNGDHCKVVVWYEVGALCSWWLSTKQMEFTANVGIHIMTISPPAPPRPAPPNHTTPHHTTYE
ncbi:hypothetical protein E2C01_038734 [Portunus trituberculatus]|uniref:Uncharacterized protein n=1 Tax=Portunus trituberculatus TaxID=210409 RepID=A0A5B7FBK6_PORTR|nr:hypothetical protein [Portunus trituberculatus]